MINFSKFFKLLIYDLKHFNKKIKIEFKCLKLDFKPKNHDYNK